MGSNLPDRDRDRFAELRKTLRGVNRAAPPDQSIIKAPGPIDPMLATTFSGDLDAIDESAWIAEEKYDGTRLILEQFNRDVQIFTRRHVERSETVPSLRATAADTLPDGVILDGEYAFVTPSGRTQFMPIHTGSETIDELDLNPRFFVFDILATDQTWCTRRPLLDRKELLNEVVTESELIRVVPFETESFQEYVDSLMSENREGILLKRRTSSYHIGTRSSHWKKVKSRTETDVLIVGLTAGSGSRRETFGALVMSDGKHYLGRVGSGFSGGDLDTILDVLEPIDSPTIPRSIVGEPYTPVQPIVATVTYQQVTANGQLRAPVFDRLRPDKPPEDVLPIEPRRS